MQAVEEPLLMNYFNLRKNYYQFIQLLFFQPITTDNVSMLKNDGNLNELNHMGLGGHHLYQFFTTVTEEKLHLEKDEFNRLFVGPGEIIAPPWESVYQSKEQLLFDEVTFKVREQYHRFGLQFVRENHEPDDHIAVELEFMIYLNQLCTEICREQQPEGENLKNHLQSQLDFLDEHLCRWVPLFSEKIIKNSESLLYTGAALLLKEFIESETESLKEIMEALANDR
jgi:putative dimethyl sulfoxide reductase chaperone